jgi:hypothetical protein
MTRRQWGWLAGLVVGCVVGLCGMSDSLWADDDDTLIILPGDRPKPRPRARAKAKTQFKRTLLPPIYGPPKEWRSYRSTSRINVAVRQGRVLWAGTQGSGLIQWDMRTGA